MGTIELKKQIRKYRALLVDCKRGFETWALMTNNEIPDVTNLPLDMESPWEAYRELCAIIEEPNPDIKSSDMDWYDSCGS